MWFRKAIYIPIQKIYDSLTFSVRSLYRNAYIIDFIDWCDYGLICYDLRHIHETEFFFEQIYHVDSWYFCSKVISSCFITPNPEFNTNGKKTLFRIKIVPQQHNFVIWKLKIKTHNIINSRNGLCGFCRNNDQVSDIYRIMLAGAIYLDLICRVHPVFRVVAVKIN